MATYFVSSLVYKFIYKIIINLKAFSFIVSFHRYFCFVKKQEKL